MKSHRYYDFPPDCLRAKSLGYKNSGYTIKLAAEGCAGNTPEGVVGRWRVDAKTGEIYVQNRSGKYVSPQVENDQQAKYGFPSEALIIEERSLRSEGYGDRALVLWMVKPERHPNESPEETYTCPARTRGSYYSGPTRVSLINAKTRSIINTVEIKQEYSDGEDSFDVPYAIHKGYYYRVEGNPKKGEEVKPIILALKDHNGDGRALEFALFDALACMGLPTTLIGYSEQQDKVIQYSISLEVKGDEKQSTEVSHWCDYLFSEKPKAPGYWKYEIDYRGRGGSLYEYEIRYNARREMFEGTDVWNNDSSEQTGDFKEP